MPICGTIYNCFWWFIYIISYTRFFLDKTRTIEIINLTCRKTVYKVTKMNSLLNKNFSISVLILIFVWFLVGEIFSCDAQEDSLTTSCKSAQPAGYINEQFFSKGYSCLHLKDAAAIQSVSSRFSRLHQWMSLHVDSSFSFNISYRTDYEQL